MRNISLVIVFVLLNVGAAYQSSRDPKDLVKNAGEVLLEARIQSDQLQELRKEISSLVARVDAGGQTSRCLLSFSCH